MQPDAAPATLGEPPLRFSASGSVPPPILLKQPLETPNPEKPPALIPNYVPSPSGPSPMQPDLTARIIPGAVAINGMPPAMVGAGGTPPPPPPPGPPPEDGSLRPVPPPGTPPAGMVMGQAANGADIRPLEEYIPFRYPELRQKLIADYPSLFQDPADRKHFEELCKWISLRNSLRLEIDYGDAHEKYSSLDPDSDSVSMLASDKVVRQSDLLDRVAAVKQEVAGVLEKAEFDEMPREHLVKALKDKSLMGLNVKSASDEYLEYYVHYRGIREKKIKVTRFLVWRREIEMHVYQRLAIFFRLKKPVNPDDKPVDTAFGTDRRPWWKKLLCMRGMGISEGLLELRDEYVYMKLFKDVLQCDVDMLLPGSVIKFDWLDYLVIWIPILFGCGAAIYKTVKGTIAFDSLNHALTSIVLIVMPLTWGIRAWIQVKDKEQRYQAHLNALFISHNLNNNSGVISQLVDEAQEQEDNEAMLAYFFLWQGARSPQPMKKIDLDRMVEAYLQKKIDESDLDVRMDFEVADSITKLSNMGLLTESTVGHEKVLQVLPLGQAAERANVRYFDEGRECGQGIQPRSKNKRGVNDALKWHECADVFRPTGQKFRFFFNIETGESTYHEPEEPYVKLSPATAEEYAAPVAVTANANTHPGAPLLLHTKAA